MGCGGTLVPFVFVWRFFMHAGCQTVRGLVWLVPLFLCGSLVHSSCLNSAWAVLFVSYICV